MQMNSPQCNNPYNILSYYPQQYTGYPQYLQQMQAARYQPQEQAPVQMQGTYQQQTVGINGRMVQSVENINANEVPMDGSMAFFPKQDMSEIYVKAWDANGLIKTIVYKPYIAPKDNQTVNSMSNAENAKFTLSDESTQLFLNKFEELSEKIGQLEDRFDKSLGTQRKTLKTQSKGGDEE
jgi:hypothetical protein